MARWIEKYIRTDDPTRLFAKKQNGNLYYARTDTGDEYYPEFCGRLAFLTDPDENPLYAKHYDGRIRFPQRPDGSEFYWRHPTSFNEFVEGLDRYARSSTGAETYPIRRDSECRYEALIANRYAVDDQSVYYYPLDCYDNEYYIEWKSHPEKDVLVRDRYAISNMGYYILPKKGDAVYFSATIRPFIPADTPRTLIHRGFGNVQDYVTTLPSDLTPRKMRLSEPEVERPLSDSSQDPPPPPKKTVPFYKTWSLWLAFAIVLTLLGLVFYLGPTMMKTFPR